MLDVLALLFAGLIFVASLSAGGWIVLQAPSDMDTSAGRMEPTSSSTSYGGDAYTGIQNAASDTEHAVVGGTNLLAEQADDRAIAENARWTHLWWAIAATVALLGSINFVVALQKFAAARSRASTTG